MDRPLAHTLPKAERLCGTTAIASLLHRGRYGTAGCLRYCYAPGNGLPYSRILVSVPKKSFKRAIKRNLLKRRLRESYRLQKEKMPSGGDLMLIYLPREILPYEEVFASVGKVLESLQGHGTE